ncbi:hypothetical protein [uncultured Nostoc sp.]|uniref:hypothetical protein n=1 Tax=uncultured Nostoc sp. TaxID=340711 RepID=UPI0035CC4D73
MLNLLLKLEVYMLFKIFGFSVCIYDGGFWFRDSSGYGLSIVDRAKYPPLFSQRNGLTKFVSYKSWDMTQLDPDASTLK